MNADRSVALELVARFNRECPGAEHIGPDMVGLTLVPEASDKAKGEKLGERQFRVTLSKEETDRHGDIVRSSGAVIKNFKKNPVVLFGHRHDIPGVGKVIPKTIKKEGGVVTGVVEFAETALGMELYYLYSNGYMKAWSIGFIPLKWEAIEDNEESDGSLWGPVDIKKWELLELSAVPVPACPGALTNALKGIGADEALSGEQRSDFVAKALEGWRGMVDEADSLSGDAQEAPAETRAILFDCRKCGEHIYEVDAKRMKCYSCGEVLDTLKAPKAPAERKTMFHCRECDEPIYEIDTERMECYQCGEPIDSLKELVPEPTFMVHTEGEPDNEAAFVDEVNAAAVFVNDGWLLVPEVFEALAEKHGVELPEPDDERIAIEWERMLKSGKPDEEFRMVVTDRTDNPEMDLDEIEAVSDALDELIEKTEDTLEVLARLKAVRVEMGLEPVTAGCACNVDEPDETKQKISFNEVLARIETLTEEMDAKLEDTIVRRIGIARGRVVDERE